MHPELGCIKKDKDKQNKKNDKINISIILPFSTLHCP